MHFLRQPVPFLGLAALALVAAPHAAHAQSLTLTNTDNVTVDSTGTHGAYQGTPINNATTSYSTRVGPAITVYNSAVFTLGSGSSLIENSGGGTDALDDFSSGAVTITGGSLAGNTGGNSALYTNGSGLVTITGGIFTGGTDLFASGPGSISLYGSFAGLNAGEMKSLPTDSRNGDTGSFFGTLENDSVGQTFTYFNAGIITLHDVAAAPEPPQFAALGLGILGIAGLAVKARRRKSVA